MSEVKRWTQPCVQQQLGEGFKVLEVPLFEDSKGKYVLASDFKRIEARLDRLASDKARLAMEAKELAQRVVTLENALRGALELDTTMGYAPQVIAARAALAQGEAGK